MPVIFDEVIANVEAPPASTAPDAEEGATAPAQNQEENIPRIVETQLRWGATPGGRLMEFKRHMIASIEHV